MATSIWLIAPGSIASPDEINRALELTPDIDRGKALYPLCAACHLETGWGKKDGTFPQLAGQHREVLVKQLADIREGNRDNPTMYPFALPRAIDRPY